MSIIFLSHSSIDELEAVAFKQWLLDNGWDDVFLDLDPERGLKAGERWQEALKRAAGLCEAVIFLISPAWAKSTWCVAEFLLAKHLHKLIFGVVLKDIPLSELPSEMTAEWQLCYLVGEGTTKTVHFIHRDNPVEVKFLASGLGRLKLGLQNAGLSADFFPWPPQDDKSRSPYRGLEPFDAQDAAVFFGRDAEILQGLDKLRGMRAAGDKNLFVILGASGSGKSSFLRAGLLPRLARNDRHFHTLEVLRPERSPLFGERGLAQAIAQANQQFRLMPRNVGDVKAALSEGAERFEQLLVAIRDAVRNTVLGLPEAAPAPTLILSVDQAEELFTSDATEEARMFLDLVGTILKASHSHGKVQKLSLIVVFTIRADRYEPLHAAPELMGLRTVLFDSLKPMPKVQFKEVIIGPAKRTSSSIRQLEIHPDLVDQLLLECGHGADTLPLLSLSLSSLYKEYGNDGSLGLEQYQRLGGMTHVIENEIESILACKPKIRSAQLEMLHAAFIPWLVTINPKNDQPMRRMAAMNDLPSGSLVLVQALIEKRLLLSDLRHGQQVVEVAHESLLRQWKTMEQWLQEEREDLKEADQLEIAVTAWNRNGRKPDWLLRGERLKISEELAKKPIFMKRLELASEFLLASRQRENNTPDPLPQLPIIKPMPDFWRRPQPMKIGITVGILVALIALDKIMEPTPPTPPVPPDIDRRLSLGEDIFFPTHVNKRSASNRFREGKFKEAKEKFLESLAKVRDDPEAMIYLNNAIAAHTDSLVIAVSLPIGTSANVAGEMLRGVAQAQQEVNDSGGIHGKRLQVKIANDDNNRKVVEELAKRLVDDAKILAVIGSNTSDVSRQAATVYQDHLVMISPTSFALGMEEVKKPSAGNYIFTAVPSFHALMPKLASYMLEAVEKPKIVVCYDSEAYDQKWFKQAISQNKKIKIADVDCNFSDPGLNLEEVMHMAVKEGANGLFLAPHVSRISEATDLVRLSNGQLKLYGSPTLYTFDTLKFGQKDIVGLVLPVHWHPAAFPDNNFYAKARILWGNDIGITWRTAMSYDATQVIIEGLNRITSPRQISRAELQKVISDKEFTIDGAGGKIKFKASGEGQGRKTFLLEVCSGSESGVGYDFVPHRSCSSNYPQTPKS